MIFLGTTHSLIHLSHVPAIILQGREILCFYLINSKMNVVIKCHCWLAWGYTC